MERSSLAAMMNDLQSVLDRIDAAVELVCAAHLQLVIDTLQQNEAAADLAARKLRELGALRGGLTEHVRP